MKLNINSARCDSKLSKDQCVKRRARLGKLSPQMDRVRYFLRRCPNAKTLSRHESPDRAKRDYACAVTPIQPMQPRGELLN
ncbi:hypothetical protein EVAR_96937_1 [Eumeta japonica]|uniref:Uncharacterized protein n=1 Tax=Eumeta variegata TaxID=151549 RepID=A0A4C1SWK0_EUMVA|nr:hypothetical protein EVAR_96937_1 [Eumeta japonica]